MKVDVCGKVVVESLIRPSGTFSHREKVVTEFQP